MRDLLLLVVVFGSIPFILIQPFIGLLVYAWLAYMRPHDMVWGSIPQISLIVALATIVGLVLAGGKERFLALKPQTLLLIAFGLWVGLTSMTAMEPGLSSEWGIRLAKILLISLMTTGLVQTEKRFRWLYFVIAFSLGALGTKYGMFGLLRGGARFEQGPGGFMIDNNSFAMALNMGIPLLAGVALVETRRWLRVTAWIFAVCTAAAVIFTFSRGGLVALLVVLAIILGRSGRPLLVGLVAALAVVGFLVVASSDFEQSYSERASSIKDYQTDASARGRFDEWGTALMIFKDHPILGVGPDNLVVARPFYVLDGSEFRTTHNSFLQLLVACGAPGLLLFLAALGVSMWRLEAVRRSSSHHWVRTYASMIQASFVAFVVGGVLLDMAYLDLVYQLMAMTVSLELAASSAVPGLSLVESAMVQPGEEEWWRTPPAEGAGNSY